MKKFALLKYHWKMFKIRFHRFWKCVTGYITMDGAPRKCPHCKSKKLETYETFMHDQGFIEEYWVRCSKCKKQVGVWAYGYWQD